jgi:hypothetical protein
MPDRTFELLLIDGRIVTWAGSDGVNAARRYALAHPEATVIACREVQWGVSVGLLKIID